MVKQPLLQLVVSLIMVRGCAASGVPAKHEWAAEIKGLHGVSAAMLSCAERSCARVVRSSFAPCARKRCDVLHEGCQITTECASIMRCTERCAATGRTNADAGAGQQRLAAPTALTGIGCAKICVHSQLSFGRAEGSSVQLVDEASMQRRR